MFFDLMTLNRQGQGMETVVQVMKLVLYDESFHWEDSALSEEKLTQIAVNIADLANTVLLVGLMYNK